MSLVLDLGDAVSRIPVPLALLRRAAHARCLVLLLHAVVAEAPPPHLRWIVHSMTTARFEAELTWLRRRYRFVGYDDVEASLDGSCALPGNAALLTFDDGYAELGSVVRPLLRRLGVPALAFLTTSALDNAALSADCKASLCVDAFVRLDPAEQRAIAGGLALPALAGRRPSQVGRELRDHLRSHDAAMQALWQRLALDEAAYLGAVKPYLTRRDVGDMAADGWSFGGHATVHRRLQGLPFGDLEHEIVDSCRAAAGLSGRPRAPFAFPYSGEGVRRDWLAEIRDRHPQVGLIFDVHGLRREGALVWHRVDVERADESVATIVRRAHLGAMLPRRLYESPLVADHRAR